MSKDKFEFEEPLSKKYQDSVFNAVKPELDYNKSKYGKKAFLKKFLTAAVPLALLVVVIGLQFKNFYEKPAEDINMALNDNLIMELAALSPDEVEIVDDLDFMDALDSLSPTEVKELL